MQMHSDIHSPILILSEYIWIFIHQKTGLSVQIPAWGDGWEGDRGPMGGIDA